MGAVLRGPVTGVPLDWKQVSTKLPATALGTSLVIEFRLDSDDLFHFAACYPDDFELTIP